jgi:hypothetical protein
VSSELASQIAHVVVHGGMGLFITLIAFRVIGKRPGEDPNYDQKLKKWGWVLKIGGIIEIVHAIVYAIEKLVG